MPMMSLKMFTPDPEIHSESSGKKKLTKLGGSAASKFGGSHLLRSKSKQLDLMSDADASCYEARYFDITATMDAKKHWATVGKAEGRLGTCAPRLTDTQAFEYLMNSPVLQNKFGRQGASALTLARTHYQTTGWNDPAFNTLLSDGDDEPFLCGEGQNSSCHCDGTLWLGPLNRPDKLTEKITTFADLLIWKTAHKESQDFSACTVEELGSDPFPTGQKQCWCEPKPDYKPTRCADEGQECKCSGTVFFGPKLSEESGKILPFDDMLETESYAVNYVNNTNTIGCTNTAMGVDPAKGILKQCYCDEDKKILTTSEITANKNFWKADQLNFEAERALNVTALDITDAEEQISTFSSAVTKSTSSKKTLKTGKCVSCSSGEITESYTKSKKLLKERRERRKNKFRLRRKRLLKRKQLLEQKRISIEQAKNTVQKAIEASEKKRLENELLKQEEEFDRTTTEYQVEVTTTESEEREEMTKEVREETTIEETKVKKEQAVKVTQEKEVIEQKEEEAKEVIEQTTGTLELTKKVLQHEHMEEQSLNQVNVAITEMTESATKELSEITTTISTVNAEERTVIVTGGGSNTELVSEQTTEIESEISELTTQVTETTSEFTTQ